MKSHELAKILLEKPDVELIMQKDAEGNGYSPLSGVDFDVIYIAEKKWYGEVLSTKWSASDACMNESEWEEMKKEHSGKHAVLHPIN